MAGVESHPFAGRNSLLAGNLAGNFKNLAGFAPFRAPRQFDRMTYQYIRGEFPAPMEEGNFRGEAGNALEGHWCVFRYG
jgi:hypothetical protein